LIVFGVSLVVVGLKHGREDAAFESRGETARIETVDNAEQYTEHQRRRRMTNRSERTAVFYNGELTFQTKAGQDVTVARKGLPPGLVQAVQGGRAVTLWYLPDAPTTIRLQEVKHHATEEKLVGLLLIALGLYYRFRPAR
jgi:hypothetical protein